MECETRTLLQMSPQRLPLRRILSPLLPRLLLPRALQKWRDERAKKLVEKAEMNRQEEEKLIEGNKEDMSCANPWERVNKLVDMNEEKEHDMSRMKQVMIRMKGDAASM